MKKALLILTLAALAWTLPGTSRADDLQKDLSGSWYTKINVYIAMLESSVYDFTATPDWKKKTLTLDAKSQRDDKEKYPDLKIVFENLSREGDGYYGTTTVDTKFGNRDIRAGILKEEGVAKLLLDTSDIAAMLGGKRRNQPRTFTLEEVSGE